ncbi:DUF3997 domain-containing protein [Evansella tamaricis]|uniref:DUF3997 domain-containing protein n=1 Tax=Evansella tamaricis TaxID=2069301 RepID=A0ABS6JKG3_9BACI|nr:DUF3997 domain-containing protein [Evansella tamaricis]MBU9713694.1 DUF3997 domain-containing protein [Evansella tamaricis]
MKKQKRYFKKMILFIAGISLLTGCAGMADYDVELPGNYSILRTSAHQVTIALKTGEDSWGSEIIPAKVTEVGWDENYIIAKQVKLTQDKNRENNYKIPDEQNYQYWILSIETGDLTGPLDEGRLTDKRKEYKISDAIILKDVSRGFSQE